MGLGWKLLAADRAVNLDNFDELRIDPNNRWIVQGVKYEVDAVGEVKTLVVRLAECHTEGYPKHGDPEKAQAFLAELLGLVYNGPAVYISPKMGEL